MSTSFSIGTQCDFSEGFPLSLVTAASGPLGPARGAPIQRLRTPFEQEFQHLMERVKSKTQRGIALLTQPSFADVAPGAHPQTYHQAGVGAMHPVDEGCPFSVAHLEDALQCCWEDGQEDAGSAVSSASPPDAAAPSGDTATTNVQPLRIVPALHLPAMRTVASAASLASWSVLFTPRSARSETDGPTQGAGPLQGPASSTFHVSRASTPASLLHLSPGAQSRWLHGSHSHRSSNAGCVVPSHHNHHHHHHHFTAMHHPFDNILDGANDAILLRLCGVQPFVVSPCPSSMDHHDSTNTDDTSLPATRQGGSSSSLLRNLTLRGGRVRRFVMARIDAATSAAARLVDLVLRNGASCRGAASTITLRKKKDKSTSLSSSPLTLTEAVEMYNGDLVTAVAAVLVDNFAVRLAKQWRRVKAQRDEECDAPPASSASPSV